MDIIFGQCRYQRSLRQRWMVHRSSQGENKWWSSWGKQPKFRRKWRRSIYMESPWRRIHRQDWIQTRKLVRWNHFRYQQGNQITSIRRTWRKWTIHLHIASWWKVERNLWLQGPIHQRNGIHLQSSLHSWIRNQQNRIPLLMDVIIVQCWNQGNHRTRWMVHWSSQG